MRGRKTPLFVCLIIAGLLVAAAAAVFYNDQQQAKAAEANYVVLSWNDLGMHCYNRDFQDLAVLPPFNTLWAQVIQVGDPPQLITAGIELTYSFPDNTYSVGKSNFWDYDQQLFGVDLPPNVGLAGKGMSGDMDLHGDHFAAEGIPLTEFRDSDLVNPYPYQLAEVIVTDTSTGAELTRSTVVAPVSTEMNCDDCHYDGALSDIATGRIETNILTLHDEEHLEDYPAGHDGALMDRRPILCAECHASNALGAPGLPGIANLSKAIHDKHKGRVSADIDGCYQCHPGPQTQCLRDVMAVDHEMDCSDCHGSMRDVAENPDPWLNEPRCDNEACHGTAYQQDQALYRLSKEHGGIYCAGCHDSPHAIAPGREANDGIKFMDLQGYYDTLQTCTVCHTTMPEGAGPHGVSAPQAIQLDAGWNMISSYVDPTDPALASIMAGIEDDLVLMKDDNGQVYWPALAIDQIVNWDVREGYQVYMSSTALLHMKGSQVDPSLTPVTLDEGWNMAAYLLDTAAPVETSMTSISSDLTLVKNGAGQVYWPSYGIDQIGDMIPGQGYQIYTTATVDLTYNTP